MVILLEVEEEKLLKIQREIEIQNKEHYMLEIILASLSIKNNDGKFKPINFKNKMLICSSYKGRTIEKLLPEVKNIITMSLLKHRPDFNWSSHVKGTVFECLSSDLRVDLFLPVYYGDSKDSYDSEATTKCCSYDLYNGYSSDDCEDIIAH